MDQDDHHAKRSRRYVPLTREQEAPVEDIEPGELNQPINVSQRKCIECGQYLPERYEPPADEDWTTGILGCLEDTDSCFTGLFCPCVLFGRNVELREDIPWPSACVGHAVCVEGGIALAAATAFCNGIDPNTSVLICEGLLFAWWVCGIYTGLFRESLQKKYHLKNSPCDPCMVHCCLHWCALCQEHREMRNHLSDPTDMQMTVVNPPPVQEMKSGESQDSASSAPDAPSVQSSGNGEHTGLEIQPV
ncbi:cell number regulator 6 [Populus alba]|nr:cell number regulator 6-like [Populus alba]